MDETPPTGSVPGGAALARNALVNFAALAVPLVAAVAAVPILVRSLGTERFGLLGLAWAALEYLAVVDAGLTRATTQSVAVAMTRDARETRQLVSVSLTLLLALGIVFGTLFMLATPALVTALDVPAALRAEAVSLFRVVGASVPVVLMMTSMRGVVEGAHRFDISAAARIPSSLASILLPAAGAYLGMSLPSLMLLVLAARAIICAGLWGAVPRAIAGFRWELPREWRKLRTIGRFAAWVGVSSVISPVLVYLDRFLLSIAAGVAAAGFYVAPYEAVTRLLLVPVSLAGALFPALAGMSARGEVDTARAGRVLGSALRQVFLAVLPAVALAGVFAPTILELWLGPEFAVRSTAALRILALGVLVNALAHVPYAYLQASGRPDLTARFHIIELLAHVPLTWMLVTRFGITGAAMAWTARVSLDALLLAAGSIHYRRSSGQVPRLYSAHGVAAVTAGVALTTALVVTAFAASGNAQALTLVAGTLALYASFVWWRALKSEERAALLRVLGRSSQA